MRRNHCVVFLDVVGAATLASGDVMVLERCFTWMGGFTSRIVRV